MKSGTALSSATGAERPTPLYRTIVADPPWDHDSFVTVWPKDQSRAGETRVEGLPYQSMSLCEIRQLPVQELCDPRGSCLFLWATNRYMPDAYGIIEAWGFRYRQTLVWDKTNSAPFAGSVAPNSEFLIYASVGSPGRIGRVASSVIRCPRPDSGKRIRSHSRKPEAFLDLVESVSPGPYLELFARRQRLGWDTWGNEALEHVELIA